MKITDALTAEHTIFGAVLDQIEKVLPSLATLTEVRTMAAVIQGLLEAHAEREANLAYLALDHVLADKGQLDRMHQDHHEIDGRLKQVQSSNTSAEARRHLKTAIASSREHFRMEEKSLFPLLEKALSRETLHALGQGWIERNVIR